MAIVDTPRILKSIKDHQAVDAFCLPRNPINKHPVLDGNGQAFLRHGHPEDRAPKLQLGKELALTVVPQHDLIGGKAWPRPPSHQRNDVCLVQQADNANSCTRCLIKLFTCKERESIEGMGWKLRCICTVTVEFSEGLHRINPVPIRKGHPKQRLFGIEGDAVDLGEVR